MEILRSGHKIIGREIILSDQRSLGESLKASLQCVRDPGGERELS